MQLVLYIYVNTCCLCGRGVAGRGRVAAVLFAAGRGGVRPRSDFSDMTVFISPFHTTQGTLFLLIFISIYVHSAKGSASIPTGLSGVASAVAFSVLVWMIWINCFGELVSAARLFAVRISSISVSGPDAVRGRSTGSRSECVAPSILVTRPPQNRQISLGL